MAKEALTPMMQQFYNLKQKHPEALLLFRCGDFYETYSQDAVIASEILGITLTRRNNGAGGVTQMEMAGFPYHALDTYLPKLIRAGKRVAICDQLEDPKLTKTLVKRGITELVTPGVAMQDTVLDGKQNNFLAAVHFGHAVCAISLLDISTGEFLVSEGTTQLIAKLITGFQPKEVLYEKGREAMLSTSFSQKLTTFGMDDWVYNEDTARQRLLKHFKVRNMKGFGIDHMKAGMVAAGVVLQYLDMTQHTRLGHITTIAPVQDERFVHMDAFTVRSLELLEPMVHDGKSLLDVIGNTVTPMGARMMRRWTVFPLKDVSVINDRLDTVEALLKESDVRDTVRDELDHIADMERILSRTDAGRVSPRELLSLAQALRSIDVIKSALSDSNNAILQHVATQIEPCPELQERLSRTLMPDAPALVAKGGVIAKGVDSELDELREIATGGKDYLIAMQQREAERTGIASLKIGYNNVFGYYLEVRNTYKNQVPPEWIRKQTLVSAERYITEELKQYENKIMGAEEKILIIESRLYNELVQWCSNFTVQVQKTASCVARLDCLVSFAMTALSHHYIRPTVDDSKVIDIRQGRHPVIESQLPPTNPYIPNDVMLDTEGQQIIMITGPNMAGKSALLRQTALITLMSQMGSFVPAETARIGYVDKIFTRVGASDNISQGESTFMVEMSEAANIINNITERSLVLFDELGRGTSTYDGISIAWSIVEYIHENKKARARTLFATHYHELNEMEKTFPHIRNFNVSVLEKDGQVIFLRKLKEGGSAHSFGIHVARMAGMPDSIVKRSEVILHQLEQEKDYDQLGKGLAAGAKRASDKGTQLNFFQLDDPILDTIRQQIMDIDINSLTPIDALNKLNEIKKLLKH